MNSTVSKEDGYISVYCDIIEYEGTDGRPKLANYKRVAYVWDAKGEFLIPADQLIKKCRENNEVGAKKTRSKKSKYPPLIKYDGGYVIGNHFYVFKNHYRKGSEEGKRRSDYRRFIEEKYVGSLSE